MLKPLNLRKRNRSTLSLERSATPELPISPGCTGKLPSRCHAELGAVTIQMSLRTLSLGSIAEPQTAPGKVQ
jgi:hypothetical protein